MLRRLTFALTALAVAASCGSPATPSTPKGPTSLAPQLTCQSDVTFTMTGSSKVVSYALPTATGGEAPVSVTCTPASGTAFPLGSTTVTCTAKDALLREASCSFKVVATGVQFGAKKFLAAGDSLTEGQNGLPVAWTTFVDPPNSYPTKLQALFDASYPGQNIVVVNRGLGGRRTEETLADLPGYLAADRPEAVLLLTGYNNLTVPCAVGFKDFAACDAAVDEVEINLRDCIRRAREFPGVRYVFVSTLTPSKPGPKAIDNSVIVDMNDHIRVQAAAEGAFLVNTHPTFLGHESTYISPDGLHLLPPGYQAIADAFYARILATIPQTSAQVLR